MAAWIHWFRFSWPFARWAFAIAHLYSFLPAISGFFLCTRLLWNFSLTIFEPFFGHIPTPDIYDGVSIGLYVGSGHLFRVMKVADTHLWRWGLCLCVSCFARSRRALFRCRHILTWCAESFAELIKLWLVLDSIWGQNFTWGSHSVGMLGYVFLAICELLLTWYHLHLTVVFTLNSCP